MAYHTPKTFRQYFLYDLGLQPDSSYKAWRYKNWALRLQLKLSQWYWKKRDPLKYLQVLCEMLSMAFIDMNTQFNAKLGGVVRAPSDVVSTTKWFTEAAKLMANSNPPFNVLKTLPTTMSWLDWSKAVITPTHIWAQTQFIWTCVAACRDESLTLSDTEKETINHLKACMPMWTIYLEDILAAHVSSKS